MPAKICIVPAKQMKFLGGVPQEIIGAMCWPFKVQNVKFSNSKSTEHPDFILSLDSKVLRLGGSCFEIRPSIRAVNSKFWMGGTGPSHRGGPQGGAF